MLTDYLFTYTFRDGGKLKTAIKVFRLPRGWLLRVGFKARTKRHPFRWIFDLDRADSACG